MPLRQRRHHGWTWVRSLRFQEKEPPGLSKIRTRARRGRQTKDVSLSLTCLSGKTLADHDSVSSLAHDISYVSCIPVEKFYFVVEGRVLSLESTLSQAGISWNVSVRMCFRLNGGAKHDVPGSWTCMFCNMGGCWPVRQSCFRCGSARGTGPSFPAGREMRYPGRGAGGPVSNGNPSTRQPRPKPRTVGPQPSPQSDLPQRSSLKLDTPILLQVLQSLGLSQDLLAQVEAKLSVFFFEERARSREEAHHFEGEDPDVSATIGQVAKTV